MKNEELKKRLYEFALRIVKFVQSLPKNWVALEIGRQLLRSGTSVDANYEEACGAFSKREFIYKLNMSFKEVLEKELKQPEQVKNENTHCFYHFLLLTY